MSFDGRETKQNADKNLGEIVAELTEKASQLVRQEVELAKAEVTDKLTKLGKGAAVAAAAGVFLVFAVTMMFHFFAWFFNDLFDWSNLVWPGYGIVTLFLFLLAAIAGFLAYRFFKKGSPPVPQMAIEEAKLTREQFERQKIERDQVPRSLERGEEVKTT
jgi:H+/Cl- antiporter ClcA